MCTHSHTRTVPRRAVPCRVRAYQVYNDRYFDLLGPGGGAPTRAGLMSPPGASSASTHVGSPAGMSSPVGDREEGCASGGGRGVLPADIAAHAVPSVERGLAMLTTVRSELRGRMRACSSSGWACAHIHRRARVCACAREAACVRPSPRPVCGQPQSWWAWRGVGKRKSLALLVPHRLLR